MNTERTNELLIVKAIVVILLFLSHLIGGIIAINIYEQTSFLIFPIMFSWIFWNCLIVGCILGSEDDRKDLNDVSVAATLVGVGVIGSAIAYKGARVVAKRIPPETIKKTAQAVAVTAGVYAGVKGVQAIHRKIKCNKSIDD